MGQGTRAYVGADEQSNGVATRIFADAIEALARFKRPPVECDVQRIIVTRSINGSTSRRVGVGTRAW